jgi:hypothetical protein
MLPNDSLFSLTHALHPATPIRIVHFFLAFMVKSEFCVTKQRWQK